MSKSLKLDHRLEYPKNVVIKARIDKDMQQKLEFCSKKLCVSKSDIIRNYIEKLYLQINNRIN